MFSIIIPTYNAEDNLKELLSDLESQTASNYELIVIDSSSTDATVDVAKSHNAKTIVIAKENFGHGKTRTLAAKQAKGDILVFLTQDVRIESGETLQHLISVFEDTDVAAVYGRQLPHKNATLFAKHLRYFNYSGISYTKSLQDKSERGIKTAFFSNSFSAYRANSLRSVGYFDSGLIFGEDMHAVAKLLLKGKKVAYNAGAEVYHSHDYTFYQEFRRYFDIGVFHKTEDWLLEEFGKPAKEGLEYIKSGLSYIKDDGKYYLMTEFVLRACLRYLGYKLGLNYRFLPLRLSRYFSMNTSWWNR